jgi:hypothetical protein
MVKFMEEMKEIRLSPTSVDGHFDQARVRFVARLILSYLDV